MAIELNKNKNIEPKQELIDLKRTSQRNFTLKTLLSLALVVIGVAMIVFFNILDMGIGLLLLGTLATAYNLYQYRNSSSFLSRAVNSMN